MTPFLRSRGPAPRVRLTVGESVCPKLRNVSVRFKRFSRFWFHLRMLSSLGRKGGPSWFCGLNPVTPVTISMPIAKVCAASSPRIFFAVSTGCRKRLLKAIARKMAMITTEIPTTSLKVSPGVETKGCGLEEVKREDSRITMVCSQRLIQSWPVDELFIPKNEVKKPSGVCVSSQYSRLPSVRQLWSLQK